MTSRSSPRALRNAEILNLQILLRDDDVGPDTTLQLFSGDERSIGPD
jgi:hypothetical protein